MTKSLSHPDLLEQAEEIMLNMPQVECKVTHYIHDGVCIRECFMPAGTVVIGHYHRQPQINNMVKGKLIIATKDGPKILEAPQTYVGPKGRKIAYVLEDTIWQNIIATDETDPEAIEYLMVSKSKIWKEHSLLSQLFDTNKIKTLIMEH